MQDNDLFLVNRNNRNYTQTRDEIMAKIEDTDYLLINRDDVNYKISGADFKASFEATIVSEPVITSNSEYYPTTLTATPAEVTNATKDLTYNTGIKTVS